MALSQSRFLARVREEPLVWPLERSLFGTLHHTVGLVRLIKRQRSGPPHG